MLFRSVHEWLVESGTIQAELTGRYGVTGIASKWQAYALAVTRYMRIGSQVAPAERPVLLREERAYVNESGLHWSALALTKGFKKNAAFRTSYTELGAWLLGRGDALVQEELRLSPRV